MCGGGVLEAHRWMLAWSSPRLSDLIRASPQCCRQCDTVTLVLADTDRQTVQHFLNLLYAGKTVLQGESEREELKGLARQLEIGFLQELFAKLEVPSKRTSTGEEDEELSPAAKRAKNTIDDIDCWRCTRDFASQSELINHLVTCEDSSNLEITCVTTESQQDYGSIEVKQEPLEEDESAAELEVCAYCNCAYSSRDMMLRHQCRTHFRRHLSKEVGHLPACPFCGKLDENPDELLIHVGLEHGRLKKIVSLCKESADDLSCTHCQQVYLDSSSFIDHLASTHYLPELKKMFPEQSTCPTCGVLICSRSRFLGHMVHKHFALFKVVPASISEQLLRLMSSESVDEGVENSDSDILLKDAGATSVPEAHMDSIDFDDATNPNLICPLCEAVFETEEQLKNDLASHYVASLARIFGSNLECCPFCKSKHSDDSETLTHIAVAHNQLERVLPLVVKKMLRGTNLFPARERAVEEDPEVENDPPVPEPEPRVEQPPADATPIPEKTKPETSASPLDGQQSLRARKMLSDDCRCLICGVRVKYVERHVSDTHIRNELEPFVDAEKSQCKICQTVLADARSTRTHVARMHGFLDQLIEKIRGEKQPSVAPAEKVENKKVESKKPKIASASSSANQTKPQSCPQMPLKMMTNNTSFGQVRCPMPECQGLSRRFNTWTRWKQHLYTHVKDQMGALLPTVEKNCTLCSRSFNSRKETLFHIALVHNRVFSSLPHDLVADLRARGMTTDPNRRTYTCPACTEEFQVVGTFALKAHLFSEHCASQMRSSLSSRLGNVCCYCAEAASDVNSNLRHVALVHNKFADFLPGEVIESLEEMGVFSSGSVQTTRDQGSGANPKGPGKNKETGAKPTPPPKPSGQPSEGSGGRRWRGKMRQGMDYSYRYMGRPVLECPLCGRADFPNRLYVKRHLLSAHFSQPFKDRYGGHGKLCPFCHTIQSNQQDNLRHIAAMHKKLTTVMPKALVTKLEENNIVPQGSPYLEQEEEFVENSEDQGGLLNGRIEQMNSDASAQPLLASLLKSGAHGDQAGSMTVGGGPEKDDLIKCFICVDEIRKDTCLEHLTGHFSEELRECFENDIALNSCSLCNTEFSGEQEALLHFGISHGKVRDFLSSADLAHMEAEKWMPEGWLEERLEKDDEPNGLIDASMVEVEMDVDDETLSQDQVSFALAAYLEGEEENVGVGPEVCTNERSSESRANNVLSCPRCPCTFRSKFERGSHLVTKHFANCLPGELADRLDSCCCPICEQQQENQNCLLTHYFITHSKFEVLSDLTGEDRECLSMIASQKDKGDQGQSAEQKRRPLRDRKLTALPECRNQLYKRMSSMLKRDYPTTDKKCPHCEHNSETTEKALKHLAFQHYRCFDYLNKREQQRLLSTMQPVWKVQSGDEDGVAFKCTLCPLKTSSHHEMKEHLVAHVYEELKERHGDYSGKDGTHCCYKCDKTFKSSLDKVFHIGSFHGKASKYLDMPSRRLFLSCFSVQLDGVANLNKIFGDSAYVNMGNEKAVGQSQHSLNHDKDAMRT